MKGYEYGKQEDRRDMNTGRQEERSNMDTDRKNIR
jgi:hypothetical protein